ncbi:MAG: hypothetical protein F4110_05990 [Acidimicrobiaceae bacterium]|nr:hypothetical protein [Acidimicrobiaceae bacterium]MXZ98379.1 hypothetical protein [Acidimicrobiaceae bacterium]MYE75332.1 hypothetical protein [Acidimicrobiaceae bacterium]MYE96583.1 hypothetical protein [Acidimicrobiaceae bacterium]MYH44479.1 hypothetical protein [Acidimicrobiaceae bacterium]
MFKIPPKCPPKRGFRSWREGLVNIAAGAVWVGLTTVGHDQAIASGIIDEPSKGLAAVHLAIIWSPLLVAVFIWQRWGRAAFPLKKSADELAEG